jgi:hypothetical protein
MIDKLVKINPILAINNPSLWDFLKENEILNQFRIKKEGKNNMIDKKSSNSRRARFLKYRESRVSSAVHAINLCENMANKNSYDYSEEEARIIIKALSDAVTRLKNTFDLKSQKKPTTYFDN